MNRIVFVFPTCIEPMSDKAIICGDFPRLAQVPLQFQSSLFIEEIKKPLLYVLFLQCASAYVCVSVNVCVCECTRARACVCVCIYNMCVV